MLKSAHAYTSMPPNKAEMEQAWVWQMDAAAGRAGADWASCLRLLERATAAANIACDGAALMAASSTTTSMTTTTSTTTTTTTMNVVGIPTPDDSEEVFTTLAGERGRLLGFICRP
jgi:hypothetical protein